VAALAEYYHSGVFGGAGAGRRPGASGLGGIGAGSGEAAGIADFEARAAAAVPGGVPGLHIGTTASVVGGGVGGPGTPGSVPGTPILSGPVTGLPPSLIPGYPGITVGGVGLGIGGSPGHVDGSPHLHHRHSVLGSPSAAGVGAWQHHQHQHHHYPPQRRPTVPVGVPGHLPGVDRDLDPGITYDGSVTGHHLTPAIASQIASANAPEAAAATAASATAAHGSSFTTMEQIETQMSDLRYLSQAPVAMSPGAGAGGVGVASAAYDSTPQPQAQTSPGSASVGDNSAQPGSTTSNSNKRKSIDDGSAAGSKQTRSKRNRVSLVLFFSFSGPVIVIGPWWC
jgi:hypothetical protein